MLDSFNLQNFRGFSSEQNIPLKPITLIYGPNSSGKSSLLKSLIVMKQTLENPSTNTTLITKGQYTDIGNFKDFINNHDTKKNFSIKFSFDLTKPKNRAKFYRAYYRPNRLKSLTRVTVEYVYKNSINKNNILNNINLYINDETNPFLTLEKSTKKSTIRGRFYRSRYEIFKKTKLNGDNGNSFDIKDINWDSVCFQEFWKIFLEKVKKGELNKQINIKIDHLRKKIQQRNDSKNKQRELFGDTIEDLIKILNAYEKCLEFINKSPEQMLEEYKEEIKTFYSTNFLVFANIIFWDESITKEDNTNYFNNLLFRPRNMYYSFFDDIDLNLDINHEFTMIFYMVSGLIQEYISNLKYLGALRDNPERYYLTTPSEKNYVGKSGKDTINIIAKNKILKNKINKQLKNLELGYSITPRKIPNEDIYLFLLKEELSGVTVSLNDVGFGVSQILPILVQSLLSQNETILIEQPEIHIHPRLQAELGSLFAECIKEPYNNNFIIETHSENIILRLQKLIRKKVITSEDISVIYVDKTERGSICYHLRIDEQGNFIDNWPNGFFEESFKEMFG